jgi:hypothetical protein
MNYLMHYETLMARAKVRKLDCYCEGHHVIPRCLGGDDRKENIVFLTPEEHYVAHQLLIKIHPNHHGIAFAALMMSKSRKGNKTYGWLRRKADVTRPPRSAQHNKKIGDANKGKKRSAEYRMKISTSLKGRKISAEVRKRMSAALVGHKRTAGLHWSDERRAKHSLATKGVKKPPRTAEHTAKLVASRRINREARNANH